MALPRNLISNFKPLDLERNKFLLFKDTQVVAGPILEATGSRGLSSLGVSFTVSLTSCVASCRCQADDGQEALFGSSGQ